MEKQYKDPETGQILEPLVVSETDIVTLEGETIGKDTEHIYMLPNGHFRVAQEKIFNETKDFPLYNEFYIKKEWIHLINQFAVKFIVPDGNTIKA